MSGKCLDVESASRDCVGVRDGLGQRCAGCIFGMLGLVLAAPLTSAAVHISRNLARARLAAAVEEEAAAPVADAPLATAPA